MTKTDEQINDDLIRLCGWRGHYDGYDFTCYFDKQDGNSAWETSPFTTSYDAFHTHVVPVLRERGLLNKWSKVVADFLAVSVVAHPDEEVPWPAVDLDDDGGTFLTAPPRTLCEAAIAVMKGNGDDQD